jgi:hypothetical protein
MSPLLENIAGSLLPQLEGVTVHEKWLECTRNYPWYPVSWLMLAEPGNQASLDKAALWFNDEQRLYWLLHSKPLSEDKWLADQLRELSQPKLSPEPSVATVSKIEVEEITEPSIETIAGQETGINSFPEKIEKNPEPPVLEPASPAVAEQPSEKPLIPGIRPVSMQAPKGEPMLFEPYHAVDYFASQGIKLNLAGMPQDKLEKQLKSFTQWLKTMKKVNAEPAAYADPVVEAQAVESNAGKEVVTEAMALVLEKQDKFDKALAIYEKLLLLHPEKGALFAARIEDLKTKQ